MLSIWNRWEHDDLTSEVPHSQSQMSLYSKNSLNENSDMHLYNTLLFWLIKCRSSLADCSSKSSTCARVRIVGTFTLIEGRKTKYIPCHFKKRMGFIDYLLYSIWKLCENHFVQCKNEKCLLFFLHFTSKLRPQVTLLVWSNSAEQTGCVAK